MANTTMAGNMCPMAIQTPSQRHLGLGSGRRRSYERLKRRDQEPRACLGFTPCSSREATDDHRSELLSVVRQLKVVAAGGVGQHWHARSTRLCLMKKGLELWSKWSAEDVDYADEWADGKNPCVEIWKGFKNKGAKGLGFQDS